MTRMTTRILRAALLLLVALAASAVAKEAPRPITVFAAASLKESLDAVAADWSAKSGQRVVVSYGGSDTLARQIERLAPADVFISADEAWMDYLDSKQLLAPRSRFNLVRNQLVLVAPVDSPVTKIDLSRNDDFLRALGPGRLAVAEVESVPAGKYAREALTRQGLWKDLSKRLAQGENVRAALAFVARGEAPLGIVYATDARVEPKVRVLSEFPETSHARIVYPAAATAQGDAEKASRDFLAYLRSAPARARFLQSGFTAP
jgi:molybdate transport system substrate-binding protein